MAAEAITSIFIGGSDGASAFIARTDYLSVATKWRRTYTFDGAGTFDTVTAMAVSPDDTSLAAYATQYNGGSWHNAAVLFTVRTGDGGYVTEAVMAEVDSAFKFVVRDAGIFWTASGKVFMAYYQESSKRHADPTDVDYVGKPVLVGYDVATNAFEFFSEAVDAFGTSMAIAYAD